MGNKGAGLTSGATAGTAAGGSTSTPTGGHDSAPHNASPMQTGQLAHGAARAELENTLNAVHGKHQPSSSDKGRVGGAHADGT